MEKILEELYDGNIRILDTITPQSEEYKKERTERSERIGRLLKKLGEQDEELEKEMGEILDMEGEIESYEITETFIVGFRLGAKIMLAILRFLPASTH